MVTAESREAVPVSASLTWSLAAGGYAFLWGVGLLRIPLGVVSDAIVEWLPFLPNAFPAVMFALPLSLFGAFSWWAVIERRDAYSYPASLAFGLLAAIATFVFWTAVYVAVWGPKFVLAASVIVALLIVLAAPAALLGGLPMMFIRRRMGGTPDVTPEPDG